MLEISLVGAFAGGLLAIFSPCSALLLPSFFAYAFQSRRQLISRTLIFFVGLVTLLVPLGMGVGFAASLVLDYRESMILVAGGLLILFGLLEFGGVGFSVLPRAVAGRGFSGKNWLSVYGMGVVYGFSGFCAGPLLGAVLTVAATSGSPLVGGGLLFAYALGMVAPLFVLSHLWERYRLGEKSWLRGRVLQIGPWKTHTFNLIAGTLFIGMGLLFITTGGTVALEGLYDSLGLVAFSYRAQEVVERATGGVLGWVWLGVIAVAGGVLVWWRGRGV